MFTLWLSSNDSNIASIMRASFYMFFVTLTPRPYYIVESRFAFFAFALLLELELEMHSELQFIFDKQSIINRFFQQSTSRIDRNTTFSLFAALLLLRDTNKKRNFLRDGRLHLSRRVLSHGASADILPSFSHFLPSCDIRQSLDVPRAAISTKKTEYLGPAGQSFQPFRSGLIFPRSSSLFTPPSWSIGEDINLSRILS